MRTFGVSGVDAVLRDIDEEERFKRMVSDNHLMPAKWRKRRLSALAAADKQKAIQHEETNRWIENQNILDAEFAKEEE